MFDATCVTNDLMEMVDKIPIKEILVDISLPNYEMELFISSELMNECFVEHESHV
jgi:hypothetical protein